MNDTIALAFGPWLTGLSLFLLLELAWAVLQCTRR